MTELAARVRAARAYADLTQQQLAEKLGLDVQSIKKTERGKRDPSLPEQWAIAEVTGVPRRYITHGDWDAESSIAELRRQIGAEAQKAFEQARRSARQLPPDTPEANQNIG